MEVFKSLSCWGCGVASASNPLIEEASGFKQISCRRNERRNIAPKADWRPSLCTISEDGIFKAEKAEVNNAGPTNHEISCVGSKADRHACSSGVEIRQNGMHDMGIPAFSPASFLFG